MIARSKRLERLRQRQRDQAHATSVRAAVTATAAEACVDQAEHDWLVTATSTPTIADLERAQQTIDLASDHAQTCQKAAAAERVREQAAAWAWQRADVALAKARSLQQAVVRTNEAREHDELAARRKR